MNGEGGLAARPLLYKIKLRLNKFYYEFSGA
jgi:hypothetical protein